VLVLIALPSLAAWAEPVVYSAAPPALFVKGPAAAPVEHASLLHKADAPTVYSIGQPSNDAQYLLELLNRARANPVAEAGLLANSTDPNVQGAMHAFSVNTTIMQTQFATLPTGLPPLAFNPYLLQSSLLHSEDMNTGNFQGHQNSANPPGGLTPNLPEATAFPNRLQVAGYTDYAGAAENVYAYGVTDDEIHASFEIDWGNATEEFETSTGNINTYPSQGGMQYPPGHRYNDHEQSFDPDSNTTTTVPLREIGISISSNSTGTGDPTKHTGPFIATYDIGLHNSDTDTAFITGVVYTDNRGTNFYAPGEGIGNVSVTAIASIDGSSTSGITANSGGYAVPVPGPGTYSVTFSGGGVANYTANVTVVNTFSSNNNGDNVKLDYILPSALPPPPTITVQPQPIAVLPGGNVSFSVTATGPGPYTYKWQFNGHAISNATTANLTVTKVAAANVGNYSVVVSNSGGPTTSNNAALILGVIVKLTTSPVSSTVTAGSTTIAKFNVAGTGTPAPSIQWQSAPANSTVFSNLTNGGNFSNVTTANLTVSALDATLNGTQFRAYVYNQIGSLIYFLYSKTATLTVDSAAHVTSVSMASDNTTINSSGNLTVSSNSSVTFTVGATGNALKYQWLLNGVSIKGATKATYTIAKTVAASAGTYSVIVSNPLNPKAAAAGSFVLSVLTKPTIITQPKAAKTTLGGSANFTVIASGNPIPGFVWLHSGSTTLPENVSYSNTTNPTTASSTIKLTNVTTDYSGSYQANITNGQGSVNSAAPALTVK
jgi:hypothetical protein